MKYKATIDDETGVITVTVSKSELERIAGELDISYHERLQEIANNMYLAIEEARTKRALKKQLSKMKEQLSKMKISNVYGVMINESNSITRNVNKHNYNDYIRKRNNRTRR